MGSLLAYNHDVHLRTCLQCHRTIGTHPDGAVRISQGYFTTRDDIRKALKAIRTIANTLLPY